jgi:hypothetical protein
MLVNRGEKGKNTKFLEQWSCKLYLEMQEKRKRVKLWKPRGEEKKQDKNKEMEDKKIKLKKYLST